MKPLPSVVPKDYDDVGGGGGGGDDDDDDDNDDKVKDVNQDDDEDDAKQGIEDSEGVWVTPLQTLGMTKRTLENLIKY